MATKYERTRLQGVYTYTIQDPGRRFQGAPDACLVITYKKPGGKKVWEKVGLKSEGYTLQMAAEVRAERMRTMRHGEGVRTAKEIQREKEQQKIEAERQRLDHDQTLAEIAASYWESDRGRNSKGAVTDKCRWHKHLMPTLGKRRISEITMRDVELLKSSLADKAAATCWNVMELLRRLANHGRKHGLCPPLAFRLEMPRRDNEKVEFLTADEAARLVKVLDEWPSQDVARMVQVAMLTGLRRGELFRLEDADVDQVHALIRLRAPKGGRSVSVPLAAPVAELLQEQAAWRDEHRPEAPYLFPGRGVKRPGSDEIDWLRTDCGAVDRIKAKAKLPKNFRPFHGLRHHYAVQLANSGRASLDMISELLTHKSTAMTKRYGQFLPETRLAAAELAASLILGKAAKEQEQAAEQEAQVELAQAEEGCRVVPFRRRG